MKIFKRLMLISGLICLGLAPIFAYFTDGIAYYLVAVGGLALYFGLPGREMEGRGNPDPNN